MNVVLGAKSRGFVDRIALKEGGPDCVELRFVSLVAGCVKKFDNGAIETAKELIGATRILWQGIFRRFVEQNEITMCLLDQLDRAAVEQIEAEAEVNDGTDNRRVFDVSRFAAGLIAEITSKLERAAGVVLPKVDAMTEPIVVVFAGGERPFSGKHFFSD